MCKSIEDFAQEYAQEREKEIIKNLLLENDGSSVEKIARLCNTSVECVRKVQEELLILA